MLDQGILKGGKYHCTVNLLFYWFGISCMETDHFCFYSQNRLIQSSQTGGQQYSNYSPFSFPWLDYSGKSYRSGRSSTVDLHVTSSLFRSASLSIENIIYLFYQTSYLTGPSLTKLTIDHQLNCPTVVEE
jgi:hypothetical protein